MTKKYKCMEGMSLKDWMAVLVLFAGLSKGCRNGSWSECGGPRNLSEGALMRAVEDSQVFVFRL